MPLVFLRDTLEDEIFDTVFDYCLAASQFTAFFLMFVIRRTAMVDPIQMFLVCGWVVAMGIAYCGIALPKRLKAKEALRISCAIAAVLCVVTSFSHALLAGGMAYILLGVFLRRSNSISALGFALITFISNLLLFPAVYQRSVLWWFGIWFALTVVSAIASMFSNREH